MGVNYLAVVVAAFAAFAVGALWYSVLFGKVWRKEMGISGEGSMSGMGSSMAGGFVATLVLAYVLDYLFSIWYITTLSTALMLAFWLWLGFVATILTNTVWYEKRSWTLYAINAGHYLVAILVAAAVLIWV
jgi:hypothetical protein